MPYQTQNPTTVHRLLAEDSELVFVDVRSQQEFEQGHVPGAYNVPLLFKTPQGMQPNPGFAEVVKRRFKKEQKIVFG